MSHENVKKVERAYDAFRRGDLEAFVALHHPDCEVMPMQAQVEGELYRGHDGVRAFWEHLRSVFEDWRPVAEEIRDHGELIIVRIRVTGRAGQSGVMFDETMWQALRVRDGLVWWWGNYRTEVEALEVSGLRE